MLPDQMKELSHLRLENSKAVLLTSEKLVEIEDYKSAANRAYYAVFSAMRAALATIEVDQRKHSGIISAFRQNFIKNNVLDISLSDIITELFHIRTEADYNDFFVVSKAEVVKQVENAKVFVAAVENYLSEIW